KPVTCTYTNELQAGKLKITKIFDAKNSGFTGKFEITYDCVNGYDGSVKLAGSTNGESAPDITVPVGKCTFDEPILPTAPANWTFGEPSFDPPSKEVTITKDNTAEVKVTNDITRDTGKLLLEKKVDGGSLQPKDWTLTATNNGVTPAKNYS